MTAEIVQAIHELETCEHRLSYVGYKEIEKQARAILRKHPYLKGFMMCMGHWFFKTSNPGRITVGMGDNLSYLKEITELICELDVRVKITGKPMKLDGPNAPLLTNW